MKWISLIKEATAFKFAGKLTAGPFRGNSWVGGNLMAHKKALNEGLSKLDRARLVSAPAVSLLGGSHALLCSNRNKSTPGWFMSTGQAGIKQRIAVRLKAMTIAGVVATGN